MLIGTPINKENILPIYILVSIYSIFYFFYNLIKNRKIEINKIDIIILVFTISTFIPLIFNTNASVSDTIYNIVKYFNIFIMYIIIKNECKKNPKYAKIITNTIIISIMFLCVIGLDEISGNNLRELKKVIGYKFIQYDEIRIGSLFTYPNTMAVMAGIGIFLSIGQIYSYKKITVKIMYILCIIVMFITMILTYSRLVYIIFALAFLLLIVAVLKKYKIKEKMNKKLVIGFIIIIILASIYIIIGLNIPEELEISDKYQKILYSVKPNTEYIFTFEIENVDKAIIKITEKNEYFDDINITTKELNQSFEIRIKTKQNTKVMYINIENLSTKGNLIIKKAFINGDEFILKYKLLPTNVVDKIMNISLKNKSAWERIIFIRDTVKAIQENWIFGLGGNAWEYIQNKYQNYRYFAKEAHCYPLQIFLENGIIGFISIICIYFFILKKTYLQYRKENIDISEICVLISIIFLFLHACLDFDMSFYYVQLSAFTILAMLSSKEEKNIKIKHEILLYVFLILISIFTIYTSIIKESFNNTCDVTKVNSEWTEQRIFETYYKLLPFDKDVRLKKYEQYEDEEHKKEANKILKKLLLDEKYYTLNVTLENMVKYLNTKENITKEEMDYVLEYIYSTEEFYKYYPDINIYRFRNFLKIIEKIKDTEYSEKFKNQLKKEINNKEMYILDFEKSRYESKMQEKYKTIIEDIKRNEIIYEDIGIDGSIQ